MNRITLIYLVTNCYGDPNKVYVGKTINSRQSNHKRTYGEMVEYTIIDEINSVFRKDWRSVESYWIEQFQQWGFEVVNKRKKGGGGREFFTEEQKIQAKGKIFSKETREKISIGNKGKTRTNETKLKLSNAHKGFKHSEETKKKMKGRIRSEESKLKQSKSTKGREITWNLGTKGKKISDEQKRKIGENNSKKVGQYNLNGELIKEFNSYTQVKNETGIDPQHVLINKNKTAGGYYWKYLNKD